jgi:hypothetical protein
VAVEARFVYCAGEGGGGEGVGEVGVGERMAVHDQARSGALRRCRDLDRTVVADQAPELGGGAVAERDSGPAGQDGGHGAGVGRRWDVAEGVDPLVYADQPAGLHPAVNVL